ncbi:MAG: MBL fold metallo-hydrolase [Patescibacteria group bacterium]
MIINFAGLQTFKIQFGDTIIAVNPASKQSDNIKQPLKFGADLTLISLDHPDFNGSDNNYNSNKTPFIIDGPGEYEVGGITVTGFSSLANHESRRINTIYTLRLESMNLCILGALCDADIPAETLEKIDGVDIVFVPIGGEGVLGPAEAYKLSVKLEAKVMIPCHYLDVNDACVSDFMNETGADKSAIIDKFTVKRKDIEGANGEVRILSPIK